jgi:hypothetical protein
MSATKEKYVEVRKKQSYPYIVSIANGMKKQSLFNKFSCKLLTVLLFFIPPFLKKKKKLTDNGKGMGMPYIVCVENLTTTVKKNVELFGSYNVVSKNVFEKNGEYYTQGLKITSLVPNVSYRDIVYQMGMVKFKVGLTYIMTVNQKQLFQPLRIVKKWINGNLFENVLNVTKDPYQQQTNIVAEKWNYEIDGMTSIIIPRIEPKTKATYYFYPDPLAYKKIEKENFAFRFFKSISDYFKKKEIIKGLSKPFTIEVANNTDEIKKDVSLFGSFFNIRPDENNYFNKENSFVTNDVLISSLTPNVSYSEILYYIMNNSVDVKFSYIRSLEGNKSQITEQFKIRTKDATGNLAQKTILPSIDPYQQQSDVLSNNEKFRIDGFTELVISELQPKTTVIYQFYPEYEEVKK